MKVILLPKAIGRLDEIYDFIKVKNENVAINIFNSILDEIKILEDFPQVAAAEPLLEGY